MSKGVGWTNRDSTGETPDSTGGTPGSTGETPEQIQLWVTTQGDSLEYQER